MYYTVKPVYNGQSRVITKVAFDESGGLSSEHQKLSIRFSRDKLRLAFVDRKPLFAGVVIHRFDCIYRLLNCEIGGLDCRVITTEYRSRVHGIHM